MDRLQKPLKGTALEINSVYSLQVHLFHHFHLLPLLTFNFILFFFSLSLNLNFGLQPLTSLFKGVNKGTVLLSQEILK